MGNIRREGILKTLNESKIAISASSLAKSFGVSRQIIVGDVALLRAQGQPIKATSKGYVMYSDDNRFIAKIAVDHPQSKTQEELECLVDLGVYILDVTVEHPIYGEITGQLNIKSQNDIKYFMDNINKKNAELLSTLTQGVHIHTISCESEAVYLKALEVLKNKEFLIEND